MTQTPNKHVRRRCCECRKWYVPKPSAVKTQKSCSTKCRLRRRARQERARRAANLANARADERVRQAGHRAQKGEEKGHESPLSQAGLSVQLRDAIEETTKELGQAQRLSLTGLRRRLRRITRQTFGKIERGAENVGHDPSRSLTGIQS